MSVEHHSDTHEIPSAAAGVRWPVLDHLAIGVERWEDAYPRFVSQLGGRWGYGGPKGDAAPYQLEYGNGMRLEFIAPNVPGGFMEKFIRTRGPSAHHITFKVPSLDEAIDDLTRLAFDVAGESREQPMWMEAFVHPKQTSLGTLVQVVQSDDHMISGLTADMAPPQHFPESGPDHLGVAMIGLTCCDLGRAHDLLGRALLGDVIEDGPGWFFVTWGDHRSILVREATATPCAPRLWEGAGTPGVAFVLFGSPDQTASSIQDSAARLRRLPHEDSTGVPVWVL